MISMEFAKEIIKGSLVKYVLRGGVRYRFCPWCESCAVGTESVSRDDARVRPCERKCAKLAHSARARGRGVRAAAA